MTAQTWHDRVFRIQALITDIAPDDPDSDVDCVSIELVNRRGSWNAVAWPSVKFPPEADRLIACSATVLDLREDIRTEPLVLAHWQPLLTTDVLDLIPERCCPISGTVVQTCDLIKSIDTHSLRSLMAEVLLMTAVYRSYWTCPASLLHHHAWPGGLALHSLEVAVAAESVRGLNAWQRDLVIVYALLHDIGKLWCYVDGRLTDEARRTGHEALGYRALESPLAELRKSDERSAAMLDALLSGAWKQSCKHPAAALGEIVRAMDRFSAAKAVDNVAIRGAR